MLPVSNKGELDYSGIEQVAAQIAQDLSQRLGLGSPEWLAKHIAQQIMPDAKEYAAWIIEVENNIRAEFWEAVNREMAGHLKKAEDLHAKAKKWRQDYDKWLKESGNISVSVEGGVGAGGEFAVTIPKLPEEQKNTFELIWEGLSKLPGAVYRGVKPHVGEITKGLEFAFLAAGVVVGYAALVVARDVAEAYILSKFPDVLKKWVAGKSMSRRAVYNVSDGIDLLFNNGSLAYMVYKIVDNVKTYGDTASTLNEYIVDIKEWVYLGEDGKIKP